MRTMMRLLVVFTAVTATAAENLSLKQEIADRQAYKSERSISQYTPSVVTQAKGDYWFVIPAAGSLAGAFGTNFRSDVMLSNARSVAQRVDIRYYAQGQTGTAAGPIQVTIPADGMLFLPDVVNRTLGKTGLGTLDFRARTSDGSLDTDARLDAFSRIWTPQAKTQGTAFEGGTTSQGFPALTIDNMSGTQSATIIGLQQDGTFRTNIGVYNDDLFNPHTFTAQLNGTGGQTTFTITVAAWSMNQVSVPAGNWGNFMITLTPDAAMSGEWWSAYGSSVDAITGDGWVSVGSQNNR